MSELESAERRARRIVNASLVSIIVNGVLAGLQIGLGIAANSHAVVGAGLDAGTDIVTSLLIVLTARIAVKPPDSQHPYGHGRAETIATKGLSFVIFFAGVELAFTTAQGMIEGKPERLPEAIALVPVALSILTKPLLAFYKRRLGKQLESPLLIADGQNMANDVVVAGAVLVGLGASIVFRLPYVDSILAIGVSLWIIKVAFTIFWESNTELMEGIDDAEVYRRIFSAVSHVAGAHHPHRTRVRKLNTLLVVDLDIEVDGKLSVAEGHEIGKRVEKTIKSELDNIYDVLVHVEPLGNVESGERYGLSRRKLAERSSPSQS